MSKPKRATLKELPPGTRLSFLSSEVSAIYQDVLDFRGRAGAVGAENSGKTVVLVVLK